MFRPVESYDAPDPFAPANRRPFTSVDFVNPDARVGMFELAQAKHPSKPLTRASIGRQFHHLAKDVGVVGTVYEKMTSLWRSGCRKEVVKTFVVSVHGTALAIGDFMEGRTTRTPNLDKLVIPGTSRNRTIATFGGKPGDIMTPPGGRRFTKFGKKGTDNGTDSGQAAL